MIIFGLAILGIIFGSFVNALVWRLHELSKLLGKKGKTAAKRRNELSITKGRSMCPHCGHELAAKDLVPVLSWLRLRGRCRYCSARIPDSPLVELATGLLFGLSYAVWPYGFHDIGLFRLVIWLAIIVGFVALAVYDLRWFLLPNKIVFPLIGLTIAQVVITALWQHQISSLLLPVAGAATIFGLFWMLYQFSGGAWIGGGDVKLALVLGTLAGTPLRVLMLIFFASFVGTLVSLPTLLRGREGFMRRIPFGPSLILATIVVEFWGTPIANWYQSLVIR